jgi:hypothetical protein
MPADMLPPLLIDDPSNLSEMISIIEAIVGEYWEILE